MTTTPRRFLAALLVTLAAACDQAPESTLTPAESPVDVGPAAAADLAEAGAAINAVNEETGAFIRAGKGASVATQYTADALLMPANAHAVGGTDAIGRQFQAVVDSGVADLTLSANEVESRDDLAVEIGRYRATNANGAPVDEGKYIVVWRREASGWKRHRDFFSSDLPPPGLAAEALPATPAAE